MKPILTLLALSAFAPAHPSFAAEPRPNIILILADDLGYMDIGANNPQTFYETPNIDALAKRGMRFTQGNAACCVCAPSRAALMTGKYPPRTGITSHTATNNKDGLLLSAPSAEHFSHEEVTLPERLRETGYGNFFAGKWHLGRGEHAPGGHGFAPDLVVREGIFFYPRGAPATDGKSDPKTTELIADEAVKFIREQGAKPWFAFLPFQAVHTPLKAPADLIAKYEQKRTSAPKDDWIMDRGSRMRAVQNHATYAAMVEQLDRAIGRILTAVDELGQQQRTLIVFTSDNGGECVAGGAPTANAPLRAGKGWPYEGGVRVPMLIVAPGVTKPGGSCDTPMMSTDLYPTLLDLTGLPLQPTQHRDGMSLVPLLKGETIQHAPLYWHYPHYGNQGGAPYGAIRDGDWKLIEWYEDGALELFHLREDPGERVNLATKQPDQAKALHEKLIAWRGEVNAIMPTRNPNHQPGKAPAKTTKRSAKKKTP